MAKLSLGRIGLIITLELVFNIALPAQQAGKPERSVSTGKTPPMLATQDKADFQYVLKLPRRATTGTFDLSDPAQYRFLMKQWEMAGITKDRHPQLFKTAEDLRQRQAAEREKLHSSKPLNAEHDLVPVSTDDTPIVPLNIISNLALVNGNVFGATAFTSMPGDLQDPNTEAITTLALYDQNDNPLTQISTAEQYAAGYDMRNTVVGNVPTTTTLLYAVGTYFYVDNQGHSQTGPLVAYATPYPVTSVKGDTGSLIMLSQQPTDVKGNGVIKVCIVRTDPDCDYLFQSQGGKFIVQFPIQATFTIPEPMQPLQNQQQLNQIFITLTQPSAAQGGTCTMPSSFNFWSPTPPNYINVSGSTMNWLFNPGPFSNPLSNPSSPCFPSNSTVIYSLQLTVMGTNTNGGTDYFFGSILTTSNTLPPPPGTAYLPPMVVAYGCVAEGTQVTMADDTRRNIETVGADERVLSGIADSPENVTSFTHGVELKPMVRLITENGHTLLLTETHPVMTSQGVKMAKLLTEGDVVQTAEGPSRLRTVGREAFSGTVWNLTVDPVNGDAAKTATTFYANGILVGDGHMQHDLELAERQKSVNVLKVLPAEWQQDYQNALEDGRITPSGERN